LGSSKAKKTEVTTSAMDFIQVVEVAQALKHLLMIKESKLIPQGVECGLLELPDELIHKV